MPKYRNVSGRGLSVLTERGYVDVAEGEVVEFSAAFVGEHYLQTGATGEEVLWEPLAAPVSKAKAAPAVEKSAPAANGE